MEGAYRGLSRITWRRGEQTNRRAARAGRTIGQEIANDRQRAVERSRIAGELRREADAERRVVTPAE